MNRPLLSTCSAVPRTVLVILTGVACIGLTGLPQVLAQTQGNASPATLPDKRPEAASNPPAPLPALDARSTGDGEAAGPRAVFAELEKDFGEFWVGADLPHSFVVRNTGAETLEILRVKASCGCTATNYDKQIAPGGEGKVNVKLKTKNFNGKFRKRVTVTTNDSMNSSIVLKLIGVAKQYISVQPRTAQFTQVKPDQVVAKTVRITNNGDEPMKLTLEQDKIGPFTAGLKEVEPGKSYDLEITGNPPYAQRLNRASFRLTTDVAAKPKIDVPCSAHVPPRLEVRPASLLFHAAQQKEVKRTVRFVNSGKTDVKVTAVEVDDPNVTAKVREQRPGRDYAIDLVLPAGYLPAEVGATLIVKTDDPETPSMSIPITKVEPPKRRARPGEKLVGKPAPKAVVQTVAGKELALGEPSDEVLLLEFYVSWCGFCRRSLPDVEKIHEKYKDKGVRVIAINQDVRTGKRAKTEEQIARHFADLHLTMERVLDPQKAVGELYLAQSYPTMYLVGRDGVLEAAHFSAKRNLVELVSKDLDRLLAGKSPSADNAKPAQ